MPNSKRSTIRTIGAVGAVAELPPFFCLVVCSHMAFKSFRDFINRLDASGELMRFSEPIATELELTELANREMKKPGGGKALLIEKPTVAGQVSPFPVAINTLGSHRRMALSLGAESRGRGGGRAGRAHESQAAHELQRSHQAAWHRPRFAPRANRSW